MRSAPAALAAALILLSSSARGAVDLELGWDSRAVWTSNVFRSSDEEEDAFSLLNGPNIGLRQRQGDLRFDVLYRPRYEFFPDLRDADAFEHYLSADSSWSIDRRTTVSLRERFVYSRALRRLFDVTDPADPEAGELIVDREAVFRNDASIDLSRFLSRRMVATIRFDHGLRDYERATRSDSVSYGGSVNLRRILSPRQSAGLGLSGSRFVNEESANVPEDRGTTVVQLFALYELQILPALRLSVSAGPAWTQSDQIDQDQVLFEQYARSGPFLLTPSGGAAPAFDATTGDQVGFVPLSAVPVAELPLVGDFEASDSSIEVFGNVVLSYDREPFWWSIGYNRYATNTSGFGATTTLDTVTAAADWQVARRWRLAARAAWRRQTTLSDVLSRLDGVLADTGSTVLLDAFGRVVTDPALAAFEVRDVATYEAVAGRLSDSAFEITTWDFQLRATHDLTRHLRVQALVAYWIQSVENEQTIFSRASDDERDSWRFELGFTWSFEPISL